ncbi:MAG: penicillin-binding protein 2 [Halofilum sp. (in: g-proteobacteria)]
MAGSDRLRDYEWEAGLYRRRAVVAGLAALVVVFVLIGRLFQLQYLGHEHYSTLSNDNRVRIEAVPPTRGLIRDRDGRVLAENLPSFRLELVPERVEDVDATLERLREFVDFDDADVERFRRAWRRARPFEGVPLRFRLSREEVARLSVNRHRFPGVDTVAGLTRHYPWGRTGVHALGYVGRVDKADLKRLDRRDYRGTDHVGKTGIEYAYEEILHGDPGFRRVEVNVEGRELRVLDEEPPVPGKDIQLTLDLGLQRFAERQLGPEDGAVVALDPRDGAVLALASSPGFDPNLFVNGIGRETYNVLRDAPNRPLFNRAIRGQYPPGSTIKPIIALNGLERKAIEHGETIHCRGYYTLEGRSRKYRDWKAHGEVDLGDAITESCDVMFYDLAMELGMTEMAGFLRKFGLGQPTGIDLPGERDGVIPDPEWKRQSRGESWYSGETVIHGIGQGYMQSTPLQLAAATAQIANRGRPVRPHLLAETGPAEARTDTEEEVPADEDAVVARSREPAVEPVDLAVDTDWDFITDSMVDVTVGERGTARAIGLQTPHRIAGKTGTSQVFSVPQGEKYDEESISKQLRDHALFIAFAPAEAPRIAVAVLVEHGGSGSAAAAPVARRVIDRWLQEHPPSKPEVDNGG